MKPSKFFLIFTFCLSVFLPALISSGCASRKEIEERSRADIARLKAETSAAVIKSEYYPGSGGTSSSKGGSKGSPPEIHIYFRYKVNGKEYESKTTHQGYVLAKVENYPAGRQAKACYDPANPQNAEFVETFHRCGKDDFASDLFLNKNQGEPTAMVKRLTGDAEKGDADGMTNLFSGKAKKEFGEGKIKTDNQQLSELVRKDKFAYRRPDKEEIKADTALVEFIYAYEAKPEIRLKVELIKEDGAWRIHKTVY